MPQMPAPSRVPDQDLVRWYRKMVEIRLFEEKVQELFMTGQVQGTTHLCQGQEAVSVGAIAAMRPGDVQTNTYRGHGEALALGMDPEVAFAELMGRSTGVNAMRWQTGRPSRTAQARARIF